MGIRQILDTHSKLSLGVASGVVIVVLATAIWPSQGRAPVGIAKQLYFSVDDGASYFMDDSANLPPFNHNGKPAVEAFVFQGGSASTPTVKYLLRLSPVGQKLLAANRGTTADSNADAMKEMISHHSEVKKPGSGPWVDITSPAGSAIVQAPFMDTSLHPVNCSDN